ncbi:MAG: mismatch repair protein MutS [Chthonomonadales bacterium]|nr:mismatch repair protein MutS [Chthonomonadales bacterium]
MTILMEQYDQTCSEFPQAIVLMRVGDFFEAYGETAKLLAETFGLTLTERDGMPMAGIPHHMAEKRVAQLVASGRQVILMEQSEDPRGKASGDIAQHIAQFNPDPSAS